MTQRGDVLRSVEQQLLALVALPGRSVGVADLTGPRHLFRAVEALVQDGDPEPVVDVDGDGDIRCRWFLGDVVMTVVVDDGGGGWVWARDAADAEVLYEEWSRSRPPAAAWSAASALLHRARDRSPETCS